MVKKMTILNKKILSLFTYLLMALLVAYLISDKHSASLKVNTTAPIDEKITLLNGSTVTIKSLLDKPMLINFWATWCSSCRSELPTIEKFGKLFANRINFLGIAVSSSVEYINILKQQIPLTYNLGLALNQMDHKWKVQALPTTYLINQNGNILWSHVGSIDEKELTDIIGKAVHHPHR